MLHTEKHGSSRYALRAERAGISSTPEINYLTIHMDVHLLRCSFQNRDERAEAPGNFLSPPKFMAPLGVQLVMHSGPWP